MRRRTWLDTVEFQFAIEDIVRNIIRSAQSSASLVIGEDGLEGMLSFRFDSELNVRLFGLRVDKESSEVGQPV